MGEDTKDWMDELKDGKPSSGKSENITPTTSGQEKFSGSFKFTVGETIYSRLHKCDGVIEYCEFTRFIRGDQISYNVRFNNPEDNQTISYIVGEEWLDKR